MDAESKLDALISLAESLGVQVRPCPSRAGPPDRPAGALIRLKGREILFLDARSCLADKIFACASALKGRSELEDMYLSPELREVIDEAT